jgi:hypothetical protein
VIGERLPELLRNAPLPDARRAEERGWRVVRAAYGRRPPAGITSRRATRFAIAVALGALALALALTPAGAKVADLVHDVVRPGARNAEPALTSLPTGGRLLVTAPTGSWVVDPDGTRRRLGAYDDAAWSPHGLFVAASAGRELSAVEPDGTVRWSLPSSHPASDPAWAPSGIRVAYRSGDSLRVVAGDGTGDRRIVRRAAPTPPAWAPLENRNVLTFVDRDRTVRAIDVESGRTLWRSAPFSGRIHTLQWSSGGRLLVAASSFYVILDLRGRAVAKGGTGGRTEAAAIAPDGKAVAVAHRTTTGSELTLARAGGRAGITARRLFAGPGRFSDVTWSPNGAWILLGWSNADQWLFIRQADRGVVAFSDISRQFAPGASGPVAFPRVAGWARTATGG